MPNSAYCKFQIALEMLVPSEVFLVLEQEAEELTHSMW